MGKAVYHISQSDPLQLNKPKTTKMCSYYGYNVVVVVFK